MLIVKSMSMCVCAGAEEDLAVHSGAEREDLCSARSPHHRPYRERHEGRILTQSRNYCVCV